MRFPVSPFRRRFAYPTASLCQSVASVTCSNRTTAWLAFWENHQSCPRLDPDVVRAEFSRKARSAIAINLVLRDRQPPPNQDGIFEVVSLAKDPASGGSM